MLQKITLNDFIKNNLIQLYQFCQQCFSFLNSEIFFTKIINCYKLVFSKNGLKSNIGSYIILILIFCCIILTIIFIQDKNRKLKYLIYDKIYIKINKNLNSPPKTKRYKN